MCWDTSAVDRRCRWVQIPKNASPGLRGADFSSSSGDLVQIADAKYNYNCMAVHGEAKEGAKIVVEPCSNGGPYQTVWKSTSVLGARGRSGSVERRRTGIATPSSKCRVDGVEDDATIQHERAVKF